MRYKIELKQLGETLLEGELKTKDGKRNDEAVLLIEQLVNDSTTFRMHISEIVEPANVDLQSGMIVVDDPHISELHFDNYYKNHPTQRRTGDPADSTGDEYENQ